MSDEASARLGVRELRAEVASVLRRAEAGERIVVTVDGRPIAQLGPVEPTGRPTIDDLVAGGLLVAPRRPDRPTAPDPVDVPVDARLDRVLDELRGT